MSSRWLCPRFYSPVTLHNPPGQSSTHMVLSAIYTFVTTNLHPQLMCLQSCTPSVQLPTCYLQSDVVQAPQMLLVWCWVHHSSQYSAFLCFLFLWNIISFTHSTHAPGTHLSIFHSQTWHPVRVSAKCGCEQVQVVVLLFVPVDKTPPQRGHEVWSKSEHVHEVIL